MKTYLSQEAFRSFHHAAHACATDSYYTALANRLCAAFMPCRDDFYTLPILKRISLKVALYMEDIVADMGLWRSLSEQCRQLFGFDVPVYHSAGDYYADEPNRDAVAYLVWDTVRLAHDDWTLRAEAPELHRLTDAAFDLIDSEFEKAPVNDEGKAALRQMIEDSGNDFLSLRTALSWVAMNDYLVCDDCERLLQEKWQEVHDSTRHGMTPDMEMFVSHVRMLFDYRMGPLALYPNEWLANLARTYGMEDKRKTLVDVQSLPFEVFRYDVDKDGTLHLEDTTDHKIDVAKDELNHTPKEVSTYDGCMAQFVKFRGQWHLNGSFTPLHLNGQLEGQKAGDSATTGHNIHPVSTDELLQKTGGRRLLFFKDTGELVGTMKEFELYPKDAMNSFPNDDSHKLPCLFVDETDPVDNVFIGFQMSPYICSPDNPYYDRDTARENAVTLLWTTAAPVSFVSYLVKHGLLPDAATSPVFCQGGNDDMRRGDMYFLMRTERREQY